MVNWVLDADIRGFFDSLSHEWPAKFIEHRISDRYFARLIRKWLKARVLSEGKWALQHEGTPQGAGISPALANVYLHYVLDEWVQAWRRRHAQGDVIIVRYADDFVMGFEQRTDAERFQKEPAERLKRFGLELHPRKTRLIEFGLVAARNRKDRGEGKPETFDPSSTAREKTLLTPKEFSRHGSFYHHTCGPRPAERSERLGLRDRAIVEARRAA